MDTARSFFESYGFDEVVGALDGTHIAVKPSRGDRDSFINRKGWASLNVMLACTWDRRILACAATHPGSCGDARIYRESGLASAMSQGQLADKFLLADSGYPSEGHLLTPFKRSKKKQSLSLQEIGFNAIHASARVVIENVNGDLKVRTELRACVMLPMCVR
jgi:hypothetical protein